MRDRPFIVLLGIQLTLLVVDTTLDRNGSSTLLAACLIGFFSISVILALKSVGIDAPKLKILGGLAVILRLSECFFQVRAVKIILLVVWGAFSIFMVIHLIEFALRRDHHDTVKKLAAVSSAYVAFPQFWNSVFLLIQYGNPNAFHPGLSEKLPLDYQAMLLFSYNVFTTVDVSDILPASRLASVAVVLAEIFAQLFVVIFIARLVGVFPQQPGQKGAKPAEPAPNQPTS